MSEVLAASPGASRHYGYDAAGQLTTQTGPVLRTWSYGTRANLTESTTDGATTAYTTNPNATMAAATTGTTAVTYTDDELGRRTQARTTVAGSETRRLDTVYDSAGRLNALVNNGSGGNTLELRTYDSDNHVSTSVLHDGATSTTTNQLWDHHTSGVPQVVADSTDAGTTWAPTTFGPAGLIATTTPTGTTTWYQTDPRGSVIELPANPDIVDGPPAYTPTGQPATTPPDPTGITRRGYRGEQTAAGLIHLRNRDYDPTTGQFLTPDPLDGQDGTTTVANPHTYANNDPLNQTDPMGLRAGDGSFTDGQAGAACDSVGGKIVWWGDTGSKTCMEPPVGRVEGGSCWPPVTPGGDGLVYHEGGCGVWNTRIECARGAWIPGANYVCQHSEGIIQGLTVVALVAGTVGTGGALAAAIVEIGGGTGIMFGSAAVAGFEGGTVGGGIVLSATVVENLVNAGVGGAGLTLLVHMARDSSGKSGATDVPSWVRSGGYRPSPGEAPADAARRVMDEHYGAGNWSRTGKWAREMSQIAKWFARHF